jgi:hypothetical protein
LGGSTPPGRSQVLLAERTCVGANWPSTKKRRQTDLVARDDQGKAYTVRYEAVNAMLLNEFLKEHRKVEELEVTVAQQQKDFEATAAHQQKQIEALTAGLQTVSAQVEMRKAAPQMVLNNQ